MEYVKYWLGGLGGPGFVAWFTVVIGLVLGLVVSILGRTVVLRFTKATKTDLDDVFVIHARGPAALSVALLSVWVAASAWRMSEGHIYLVKGVCGTAAGRGTPKRCSDCADCWTGHARPRCVSRPR